MTQCESYRRHGGAFTLGPMTWQKCGKQAHYSLTVKQERKVAQFPACKQCWQEAVERKMDIRKVTPI